MTAQAAPANRIQRSFLTGAFVSTLFSDGATSVGMVNSWMLDIRVSQPAALFYEGYVCSVARGKSPNFWAFVEPASRTCAIRLIRARGRGLLALLLTI